ncbi:MAG: glycosyltransferase family 2 protein [Archaeoglobaceae archaeon]
MRSIIIAAYKDPGYIEQNVKNFRDEELIVAADQPGPELVSIIEKYGLKATISTERRGKANSLNDAVQLATGEYLVFIDSDTRVLELGGLDGLDAADIRKEVNSSTIMEKLANIDYFNMLITSMLVTRLNSCLSVNGAAICIRKDVLQELGGFRRCINEDTDLGLKLGMYGYNVGVAGRALTKAPSSLRDWLFQRERWGLGGAQVVLENFKTITRKPKIWVPSLILLYPALIGLMINFLLPASIFLKLLYFILPFMLFLPNQVVVALLLAVFEWQATKNLLTIIGPFFVWLIIMLLLSKKIDYHFKARYLPIYFFVYSPLWTAICAVSVVKVAVYKWRGKELAVKNWPV